MAILWPAFALFALTMVSVLRLARMRFAAARTGAVDPRFYPLSKPYFSPHTGLVPLPGVGHFPQSEAPGKFAAVVTSFVVQ